MIDKDFVAAEHARMNAELNSLHNVEGYLSNGYSNVPSEHLFDLEVSNLPAKAGNEQHYLFLFDTHAHLRPGGRLAVVVISVLEDFIKRTFMEVFGNHEKILQGGTYSVAQALKA
jgi:16S rRNA G1207 methylase RsmC